MTEEKNVQMPEEEVAPEEDKVVEEPLEEVEEAQPEETQESEEEAKNPEVEALEEKLKNAEAQNAELKDRLIRVQADFENFRKRAQREKEDISSHAKESVVSKLLPVLDNFDLAIEHGNTENMEAYSKGVELVAKQLKDVLADLGLKEVEALGQEFDPNFHHGVAVDQNPEIDDQKVTEVFQKGYELKGKVIRPAMVKVNQK